MATRNNRWWALAFLLLACGVFVGYGVIRHRQATAKVRQEFKVTLNGKALGEATVILHPTSPGLVATGTTGSDGGCTFTVKPGDYQITVLKEAGNRALVGDWLSPPGDPDLRALRHLERPLREEDFYITPERYSKLDTTPLTVTIRDDPQPPIALDLSGESPRKLAVQEALRQQATTKAVAPGQ